MVQAKIIKTIIEATLATIVNQLKKQKLDEISPYLTALYKQDITEENYLKICQCLKEDTIDIIETLIESGNKAASFLTIFRNLVQPLCEIANSFKNGNKFEEEQLLQLKNLLISSLTSELEDLISHSNKITSLDCRALKLLTQDVSSRSISAEFNNLHHRLTSENPCSPDLNKILSKYKPLFIQAKTICVSQALTRSNGIAFFNGNANRENANAFKGCTVTLAN